MRPMNRGGGLFLFNRELLAKLRNSQRRTRGWYNVRNIEEGVAEVFIYDVIGLDWWTGGGVTSQDFVRDLRAISANKIMLRINSPGGDVNEGIAIRNALLEHPATIETHIDSAAYSTASWIGLTGEKVIMAPHATMMIHEPWDIVGGDAEAMRKTAEMLDLFGDQIAEMYTEKAGGSRDDWRAKMRLESWFTDQEAVSAGLADEVSGQAKAENTFDRSILALFKNTPAELLTDQRNDRPELTKRLAEDALRDAGFSRETAKAMVSKGWPDARDATSTAGGDELTREKLRFEAWRARQLVAA